MSLATLRAAWTAIVGADLAAETHPVALLDGGIIGHVLVVEVPDVDHADAIAWIQRPLIEAVRDHDLDLYGMPLRIAADIRMGQEPQRTQYIRRYHRRRPDAPVRHI